MVTRLLLYLAQYLVMRKKGPLSFRFASLDSKVTWTPQSDKFP